jgi:hypothetical protein
LIVVIYLQFSGNGTTKRRKGQENDSLLFGFDNGEKCSSAQVSQEDAQQIGVQTAI